MINDHTAQNVNACNTNQGHCRLCDDGGTYCGGGSLRPSLNTAAATVGMTTPIRASSDSICSMAVVRAGNVGGLIVGIACGSGMVGIVG